MVRPQDVVSDQHGFESFRYFSESVFFFFFFSRHSLTITHTFMQFVFLHDNLIFFRNSHGNVKSVVVWLAYSDKNTLTVDKLTAGDDCSGDATLSDEV